jgi:hypothetical protein
MRSAWDIVILLGAPLALAVASQCSKGLVVYFKEFSGLNRRTALATAKTEMKKVAPDLCLIALGADFGAGSYIYAGAGGGGFLLNKFGILLVAHFILFIVTTSMLILATTERYQIWLNNMLGIVAVAITAGVIIFSGQ